MKKAASIVPVFILVLLLSSAKSYAHTTVDISNNEDGSKANVNIQNSFNTSNSDSNTVESRTKVRIETNGEVKEYESTNGEDVHIESSNGNARVNIVNRSNTGMPSPSDVTKPTITDTQERIDEATKEAQKKVEDIREKQKNFFERLEELIRDFFSNLF